MFNKEFEQLCQIFLYRTNTSTQVNDVVQCHVKYLHIN